MHASQVGSPLCILQVGFTTLPRSMCFSPVKNNVVDASKKQAAGLPIECAGSAECDAYRYPTPAFLSCSLLGRPRPLVRLYAIASLDCVTAPTGL